MRKKMQNLLITTALWLLNKCHYQIPIVRPNIISRDLGKKVVSQEKMSYWQLAQFGHCESFGMNDHIKYIKSKVKEALAQKIADEIEVFTLKSPDGLVFRADVVFCDMTPYEKTLYDYE